MGDEEEVDFDQTAQSSVLQRIGLAGLLLMALALCVYAVVTKLIS